MRPLATDDTDNDGGEQQSQRSKPSAMPKPRLVKFVGFWCWSALMCLAVRRRRTTGVTGRRQSCIHWFPTGSATPVHASVRPWGPRSRGLRLRLPTRLRHFALLHTGPELLVADALALGYLLTRQLADSTQPRRIGHQQPLNLVLVLDPPPTPLPACRSASPRRGQRHWTSGMR